MKYKSVINITGKIMLVSAAFFLLPLLTSFIYDEADIQSSYIIPMAILLVLGILFVRFTKSDSEVYIGEGFLIVTLSWIVVSVFGAMPFVLSGFVKSPIDALFETVSGFTTTGSTIMQDVESLPHSLLMWRSFTHWIGGMGVLVFLLALTNNKNIKTMYIMRAESPGPKAGKLVSKMKYTAQILYTIYFALTILEYLLLLCGGMGIFDAITTAFATAGTGGFGVRNANIAAYNSPYVEYVIATFMMLFGVNFGLYFLILVGKGKEIFKNSELKWYVSIIFGSVVVIAAVLIGTHMNVADAIRYAYFTVTSTVSTTGFVAVDYEQWPNVLKIIIFLLTFVGGCASSTGGGLKIVRLMILAKLGIREIKLYANPRVVKPIIADGKAVDSAIVKGIANYFIVYVGIIVISVLLISFDNISMMESLSGVITCVNNVGPGFERLGATGNFAFLSGFSKLVLIADMILGRLELFPVIALFSYSLRRSKKQC